MFEESLGGIFERSPWVAASVADRRPFSQASVLLDALCDAVSRAPEATKLALLQAHPMLAGREARAGGLTAHSTQEQASAGLDTLTMEEADRFDVLNAAYLEKFGFPFIVAVKTLPNRHAILDVMVQRLDHPADMEFQTALGEVMKIANIRLRALLQEDIP